MSDELFEKLKCDRDRQTYERLVETIARSSLAYAAGCFAIRTMSRTSSRRRSCVLPGISIR